MTSSSIDHHALVSRHDIRWISPEGQIPVGNGNFAFNADRTGLQTFGGNTMSHWCWHSFPLPDGCTPDQVKPWATADTGRLKGPTTPPPGPLYEWHRVNLHPLNLARLGFIDAEGRRLLPDQIQPMSRHLNLWSGLLVSRFLYQDQTVEVETCVDPTSDTIAVRVTSPLLSSGLLKVQFDFPAPGPGDERWLGDFSKPSDHHSKVLLQSEGQLRIERRMDDTCYSAAVTSSGPIEQSATSPHLFILSSATAKNVLEFTCSFAPEEITGPVPGVDAIQSSCAEFWPAFWKGGGAIDLSESRDPRWKELERRIVLSQYQLAVNSAGDYPPAEVGLTGTDPWQAKWHFEMIWWHLAHFSLWDRGAMADKALSIYQSLAPMARSYAENFGYRGLMWPKACGPNGYHTGYPPSLALLWRIPHPIFLAELEYRNHPHPDTLVKWKDVVFGTADFMADYPNWNAANGQYDLDPVWPACEGPYLPLRRNTVFELGYWRFGLGTAQEWRRRLNLPENDRWQEVLQKLAPLPILDGLYLYSQDQPETYGLREYDHLDILGIAGMLPPFPGFDPKIAHQTVCEVARDWNWEALWGWDFPWLAMAAARVGEPQLAIEALLNPARKNHYDERGICTGGPGPYFPGNGGLLYAVAMMAAGWDGAPGQHAPGFPQDGSWTVKWEGLRPAL